MINTVQFLGEAHAFPKPHEIFCSHQFMVEEHLELPCSKPDIERLVDVKIHAYIESHRFLDSPWGKKVFIGGCLEQDIMYIADAPCQPLHAWHVTSRFHSFIDLAPCSMSSFAALESHRPQVLVEFMEAMKVCPRSINKSIILFVWYPVGLVCPPAPPPIPHHICPQPVCEVSLKPHRPVKKHRHFLEE